METREYTITKLREPKRLGLPAGLLTSLGLKKGDILKVESRRNGVFLKPKEAPHARDELTPRQRVIIDKRLAEGLKDFQEGRVYGPFFSLATMLRALNGKPSRKKRRIE